MSKAKKINRMSTIELISEVQKCLAKNDRSSDRFIRLNDALPERYRVI